MDISQDFSEETPAPNNLKEVSSPISPLKCSKLEEIPFPRGGESVDVVTPLYLMQSRDFIMFENISNICWLDATMALLVHNQTIRQATKLKQNCQISKIIHGYDHAINILNDFSGNPNTQERLHNAKKIMLSVQKSSLKYLQPSMKWQKGKPDSAFCCLLNLIHEDKLNESVCDVSYRWASQCEVCKIKNSGTVTKSIITITNIKAFSETNVTKFVSMKHISPCHRHSRKIKHTVKLVYNKLPSCLIFHFEDGAGKGKKPLLNFHVASREYQLTGIMLLEIGSEVGNHFITYIRDPSVDKWLECNDLRLNTVSFSSCLPKFDLKNMYIYVYETFDGLGTIETEEIPLLSYSSNFITIDISDDSGSMELNTAPDDKEQNGNVKSRKDFSGSLAAQSHATSITPGTDIFHSSETSLLKEKNTVCEEAMKSPINSLTNISKSNNEIV